LNGARPTARRRALVTVTRNMRTRRNMANIRRAPAVRVLHGCWAIALASVFAACRDAVDRSPVRASELRDVTRTGAIADKALTESSGLTPSTWNPGVFWSHNDSGNEPLLFALDTTGAARGRYRVTGAANRDWEAIALGPCTAGTCLYIADVGDNSARRRSVVLWRVREPALAAAAGTAGSSSEGITQSVPESATESATRLAFRYPDEPHDVEAIWVSPDTSVWIVTKRPLRDFPGALRPVLLFRLPSTAWQATTPVVAELVDSLPLVPVPGNSSTWVTDAAFTSHGPDGASVVVRTYQEVMIFDAEARTGRPGKPRARCRLTALYERLGEAVAWLPDGRLVFASEGKGSRLWAARC
jgi:hypothetical protein